MEEYSNGFRNFLVAFRSNWIDLTFWPTAAALASILAIASCLIA